MGSVDLRISGGDRRRPPFGWLARAMGIGRRNPSLSHLVELQARQLGRGPPGPQLRTPRRLLGTKGPSLSPRQPSQGSLPAPTLTSLTGRGKGQREEGRAGSIRQTRKRCRRSQGLHPPRAVPVPWRKR